MSEIHLIKEPITISELKKIAKEKFGGDLVKYKLYIQDLKKSWDKYSLEEQLANIGAEVGRTAKWQGKDQKLFEGAKYRALELFDLTIDDPRWIGHLREIGRVRELFCEAAEKGKIYETTLKDLEKYFIPFMFLARKSAI